MIELRAGHTRIDIHPLMLLLSALAVRLGLSAELAATAIALLAHESAHLIAAKLTGVRMERLRLMPFGGAALPGNVYALSTGQLLIVAAAGPLANGILLIISAALAQWGLLSPATALLHLRVNLALMLFNLLPALPLDGGRMLYALTAPALGRSRAAELGILLGRVEAAGLIAVFLQNLIAVGRCNISLAACAVFMLSSAPAERRALADLRTSSPLNALKDISAPIDLRLCAVDEDISVLRALRHTAPDAATLYAVYRSDHLAAFVDERRVLELALEDADSKVGRAI